MGIRWFVSWGSGKLHPDIVERLRGGSAVPPEQIITQGDDIYYVTSKTPTEDELPEGLRLRHGQLEFQCRSCEAWTDWPAEAEDYEEGHYANVCGGSPWCLP